MWLWYLSINIGIFPLNHMQTPPSVANLIDCYVKNIYILFQYWQFLIDDPKFIRDHLNFLGANEVAHSPYPLLDVQFHIGREGGACQYCRQTRTQVSNMANPMEKYIRWHFSSMIDNDMQTPPTPQKEPMVRFC